jgi:hypothetical protein
MSLGRIEISASVKWVCLDAFGSCASLQEVVFAPGSRVELLHGFRECRALHRIEIPASTRAITLAAFAGCSLLAEAVFRPGSRLRKLSWFGKCILSLGLRFLHRSW